MSLLRTATVSPGPSSSGGEPTPEAEKKELRVFVSMMIVKLFTKCFAYDGRSLEDWAPHIKRLVTQTVEGLTVQSCPDVKNAKKLCKAALKDLEKQFGDRHRLGSLIRARDADADAAVVKALQARITEFCTEPSKYSKWTFDKRRKFLCVSAALILASVLVLLLL